MHACMDGMHGMHGMCAGTHVVDIHVRVIYDKRIRYIYIYIYTYIYMYICIYLYLYTYPHVDLWFRTCVCIYNVWWYPSYLLSLFVIYDCIFVTACILSVRLLNKGKRAAQWSMATIPVIALATQTVCTLIPEWLHKQGLSRYCFNLPLVFEAMIATRYR